MWYAVYRKKFKKIKGDIVFICFCFMFGSLLIGLILIAHKKEQRSPCATEEWGGKLIRPDACRAYLIAKGQYQI